MNSNHIMSIDTDRMLSLTAKDMIGQSVAILGIKGSGKSNTAAVLMEEALLTGIPITIVDIAGEYFTLKEKHNIFVIGQSLETTVDYKITEDNARKVAKRAYESGTSIVFDVSGYEPARRGILLQMYFSEIWSLAAVQRIPLMIFLEEAHNWVPQRGQSAVKQIFIDVASEGRKRGLSLVLIGQRSARIDKDTLSQADIAFLHKVRHPIDMKVYMDLIPREKRHIKDMVNRLKVGEAIILVGERVVRSRIRLRQSRHVGFTPTLEHVPDRQMSLFDLSGK